MGGPRLLALVGPTASGKSEAAVVVGEALGAEVVSVDSMVVYRGMDIGTAKPTPAQRNRVRHHLIDVAEPSQPFSVARYQALGRDALARVEARGRPALLAGGSGLYFRALVDDLEFPGTDAQTRAELELECAAVGALHLHGRLSAMDPAAAAKIEPRNQRRTIRALEVAAITGRAFSTFASGWDRFPSDRIRAAGVAAPRDALDARVRARVAEMLERGLLAEVRSLVGRGLGDWFTATQAIGYAEFARHLQGGIGLEDAVELTVKRTRNLARRQLAWFRRDPRIRWFDIGPEGAPEVADEIRTYLAGA
jgi:tRNA dimethylallyltransferase